MQKSWASFSDYCSWCWRKHRLARAMVMRLLYHAEHLFGLVLFLAEAKTRFEYAKIWAKHNPIQRALQIWCAARALDTSRMRRVRGKVERWFRRGNIMPTRVSWIFVPAERKQYFRPYRRAIKHALRQIGSSTSPLVQSYLAQKVRIQAAKRSNISERLSDQI
eukprot:14569242-Alexandrium_andersonii.AAC.1